MTRLLNLTRTRYSRAGALWARIAQNVKKLTLRVNVIDFEFFVLMYSKVLNDRGVQITVSVGKKLEI